MHVFDHLFSFGPPHLYGDRQRAPGGVRPHLARRSTGRLCKYPVIVDCYGPELCAGRQHRPPDWVGRKLTSLLILPRKYQVINLWVDGSRASPCWGRLVHQRQAACFTILLLLEALSAAIYTPRHILLIGHRNATAYNRQLFSGARGTGSARCQSRHAVGTAPCLPSR